MKRSVLIIFLMCAALTGIAQVQLNWSSMVNIFGRTEPDAMQVDDFGNTLIAGKCDTGSYVSLLNPNGLILWTQYFNNNIERAIFSKTGDIYVCGERFDQSMTYFQACLIKIDFAGNIQWSRNYGYRGIAFSLTEDSIGQPIICGSTVDSILGQQIFIAKYDNSGTLLWSDERGDLNDPQDSYVSIASVTKNRYEDLILSGSINYGFGSNIQIIISKYLSDGPFEWSSVIDSAEYWGRNIALDALNNFAIAYYPSVNNDGSCRLRIFDNTGLIMVDSYMNMIPNVIQFLSDTTLLCGGSVRDSLVPWVSYSGITKLDYSGNTIWQNTYSGDEIKNFDTDSMGACYAVFGYNGISFQKTDPMGNLLWTESNNDSGLAVFGGLGSFIDVDHHGSIRVVGYFCHDSHCNSSHTAILKYNQLTSDLNSILTEPGTFSVYPNPANGNCFISTNQFRDGEKVNIRIYQTEGKLVFENEYQIEKGVAITVAVSHFVPGFYFINAITLSGNYNSPMLVNH